MSNQEKYEAALREIDRLRSVIMSERNEADDIVCFINDIFISGNNVPVDRITLTRDQWEALRK